MATTPATVQLEVTDNFTGRMSHLAVAAHLVTCRVCQHYCARRGGTLLLAVIVEAARREVSAPGLMLRYVRSVHDRHLAGDSLSTRPATPPRLVGRTTTITVQRACNGCGKQLGDATLAELEADRLPDVRLECGCWTEDAATCAR